MAWIPNPQEFYFRSKELPFSEDFASVGLKIFPKRSVSTFEKGYWKICFPHEELNFHPPLCVRFFPLTIPNAAATGSQKCGSLLNFPTPPKVKKIFELETSEQETTMAWNSRPSPSGSNYIPWLAPLALQAFLFYEHSPPSSIPQNSFFFGNQECICCCLLWTNDTGDISFSMFYFLESSNFEFLNIINSFPEHFFVRHSISVKTGQHTTEISTSVAKPKDHTLTSHPGQSVYKISMNINKICDISHM